MAEVRPVVVLLHAFGLSGRSWDGVVAELGDGFDCVALDLPGYGGAADSDRLTVEQTSAWVAALLRELEPERWLLVGHSMGGKIAQVVTAWAERGEHGLAAPDGVVLVNPSTPTPEPMGEDRRQDMESWCADGPMSRQHAEHYVHANGADALPALREAAVEDATAASPRAWLEWLQRGSREDWSGEVGTLRTPTAVLGSPADGDLGADAQRRLNLPHLRDATMHEIDDAHHFVVLEQPGAVAEVIREHWRRVAGAPVLPAAFARLIASDRVSAKTRRVLLARLDGPGDAPRALEPAQRALLTALLTRVLPQRGTRLDVAGRIDSQLAAGNGDGWRFGDLPADAEAWRRALDTVAALAPDFAGRAPDEQDAVVRRLADGDVGEAGPLTGDQVALWFQDLCAEAVRVWLSHPAAQAWVRYDGFADGGDDEDKQGFVRTQAGEREPWQRDWRTGEAWA
ncbi:alpha/beta hydrolase [Amnibacterium endophyticum]|uniref:Alpha/beta fold hydrolase n=1 Tax=Amnibacterium endophyticum TaxID=2109337 RepID=A0ABW4LLK0_9MICO